MPEPTAVPRTSLRFAAILLILFAVIIAGWPTIWLPLGRDHGTAAYIGDLILKGKMPFTDAWEIRTPGIYYIYALAITLFGKTGEAVRYMDLLYQFFTALALYFLGRRWFNALTGTIAALLYVMVYFWSTDFWSLFDTDSTIALPAVLALLAILPHHRGPRAGWDFITGLLIAAVVLIRITQGLLFLPILTAILLERMNDRPYRWKARLFRILTMSLGFIGALGFYAAYLVYKGAFHDFYYTLFVFAPQYTALTQQKSFMDFLHFAAPIHWHFIFKFGLPVLPALTAGGLILIHRRSAAGFTLLLWCLATLLAIDVMAKFYAYHWLPLFAPMALLAGFLAGLGYDLFSQKRVFLALLIVVVFLYGLSGFISRFGPAALKRVENAWVLETGELDYFRYLEQFSSGDSSIAANYAAVKYLKEHTKPDDPVFIWGFEPEIYYLSDRYPPTRFFINYPIIARWHRKDWYEELLRDLIEKPPVYVLLLADDAMPWITGEGLDSLQLLGRFPELRRFFLDNYQLEQTIAPIHVLRHQPPSQPL